MRCKQHTRLVSILGLIGLASSWGDPGGKRRTIKKSVNYLYVLGEQCLQLLTETRDDRGKTSWREYDEVDTQKEKG